MPYQYPKQSLKDKLLDLWLDWGCLLIPILLLLGAFAS